MSVRINKSGTYDFTSLVNYFRLPFIFKFTFGTNKNYLIAFEPDLTILKNRILIIKSQNCAARQTKPIFFHPLIHVLSRSNC